MNITHEHQRIPRDIKASLNLSWKEGVFSHIMLAVIDYFVVPYALFLGATAQQIGILLAMAHLMASLVQFFSPTLIRLSKSRVQFLSYASAVQATVLVPMAALAFISFEQRIFVFGMFLVIFRIMLSLSSLTWQSLVSDYLPPTKRGHFLGWRSQVVGLAGLAGLMISGILLSSLKQISISLAFAVLFLLAASCRFLSSYLQSKLHNVPQQAMPGSDFTFVQFVKKFRESNFVKFVFYVSSITFATNIAAPYFSVFMLRDLHMNYLTYMAVHVSGVISGLIAFPIWGKHSDMVGNARILKMTSFLVPVIPLLWLCSSHVWYLMMVEFFSGFIWGGFNLCVTNFIFDSVIPQKRVRCLGYFNLINGVAIFLGSVIGGFLADRLHPTLGFSLLTLFIISALLRFSAHFILSGRFHEVRETPHQPTDFELFASALGIRPLVGLTRGWLVVFTTDDQTHE